MLKSFSVILGLAACKLLLWQHLALASQVLVLTENYPPLNYVEADSVKGPSVEIVRRIMHMTGNSGQIRVLPWARAYDKTRKSPNTALFSITKTKARENNFHWVGPIAIKRQAFYVRDDMDIQILSLDDARNLRIGVQLKGADEDFLIEHSFDNIEAISNWEFNANKLVLGRIDAWFVSASSAERIINRNQLHRVIRMEYVASIRELYIAMNLQTDPEVIRSWRQALITLQKNGIIQQIYEKNGLSYLAPIAPDG